jgi:aspartate-semialdehyde dehydrogenase
MSGLRIAVVGATGQVGGVLLDLLEQRPFWGGDRVAEVVPFA